MNATAPWKLDTPDVSDVLPESPDLLRRQDSGAEQLPLATLADTGQLADLTPLFDAESIDGGKIRDGLNPVAIEAGDYGGKEVVDAIDSLEPNAWRSSRRSRWPPRPCWRSGPRATCCPPPGTDASPSAVNHLNLHGLTPGS